MADVDVFLWEADLVDSRLRFSANTVVLICEITVSLYCQWTIHSMSFVRCR